MSVKREGGRREKGKGREETGEDRRSKTTGAAQEIPWDDSL